MTERFYWVITNEIPTDRVYWSGSEWTINRAKAKRYASRSFAYGVANDKSDDSVVVRRVRVKVKPRVDRFTLNGSMIMDADGAIEKISVYLEDKTRCALLALLNAGDRVMRRKAKKVAET